MAQPVFQAQTEMHSSFLVGLISILMSQCLRDAAVQSSEDRYRVFAVGLGAVDPLLVFNVFEGGRSIALLTGLEQVSW